MATSRRDERLPDPIRRMGRPNDVLVRMYGQKLEQLLASEGRALADHALLRSAELAVTETRDDNPVPGSFSGCFLPRIPISSASSFAITRTAKVLEAWTMRQQRRYPRRSDLSL